MVGAVADESAYQAIVDYEDADETKKAELARVVEADAVRFCSSLVRQMRFATRRAARHTPSFQLFLRRPLQFQFTSFNFKPISIIIYIVDQLLIVIARTSILTVFFFVVNFRFVSN
jgi:hypothetical protein